jgi:antirestriction protein
MNDINEIVAPAIYVGTYAKYNNGSIKGEWMILEGYTDKEDFLAACATLHCDEEDPEFMFQDFEGIPRHLVSESDISSDIWDWLALPDDDKLLLSMYWKHVDKEGDISDAQDKFLGRYKDPADYAYSHYEETGLLNEIPEFIRGHIDWEGVARDMGYEGMIFAQVGFEDCWVFSN